MSDPRTILFIADAWDTLDHVRDTTLHLAATAIGKYSARAFWTEPQDVFFEHGHAAARTRGELRVDKQSPGGIALQTGRRLVNLSDIHSVHWRKDPPVDLATMRLWQLLDSTLEPRLLVNSAAGLLHWHEKFAPLRFGKWTVPTFVSNSLPELSRFIDENAGRKIIAKPASEAASRGVAVLPADPEAAKTALTRAHERHGPWLLLQEVDDSIRIIGETRAIVIGGKIAASLNKTPVKQDDVVMNLDSTPADRPKITRCTLSSTQEERVTEIARKLSETGIHLASIDMIGDRILEINVTSVGLLRWFDEDSGDTKLAEAYWQNLL